MSSERKQVMHASTDIINTATDRRRPIKQKQSFRSRVASHPFMSGIYVLRKPVRQMAVRSNKKTNQMSSQKQSQDLSKVRT